MTEIKKPTDLQEESNTIQAEMVDVIKKYDKTTSRHNWLMAFLTVVIIILTFATLCNKTGRYAISGAGTKGDMYVLDTKTSQLWLRGPIRDTILDFGTNENPKVKFIELKDEQIQ